jgi:hypothetical protein
LDVILLPVSVQFKDIVSFISQDVRAKHPHPVEIGVHLGQFLASTDFSKSVRYVLVCVTLHGRPSRTDPNEVETFLVVNLPSGKRGLGESTPVAASRILLEQTGIIQQVSDHSCARVLYSPDRCQKTFVDEVSCEPPSVSLPDIKTGHISPLANKSPSRSLLKIFPHLARRNGGGDGGCGPVGVDEASSKMFLDTPSVHSH